ncbi:hypothetical protein GCM10022233_11130 [Streptomyces shaanxiensis]|uniref:Uncharacterized protein n=1 Tax=Streptomyces shaanxiensis TaxID=653357 RepID=A0ABP7UHR6_9ACTN
MLTGGGETAGLRDAGVLDREVLVSVRGGRGGGGGHGGERPHEKDPGKRREQSAHAPKPAIPAGFTSWAGLTEIHGDIA